MSSNDPHTAAVVTHLNERIEELQNTLEQMTYLRDSLTKDNTRRESILVPTNESLQKAGYSPSESDEKSDSE